MDARLGLLFGPWLAAVIWHMPEILFGARWAGGERREPKTRPRLRRAGHDGTARRVGQSRPHQNQGRQVGRHELTGKLTQPVATYRRHPPRVAAAVVGLRPSHACVVCVAHVGA